jgi:hypothetical protein
MGVTNIKRRSLRVLFFSAIVVLGGVILSVLGYVDAKTTPYIMSIGVAMLFVGIAIQFRNKDEGIVDERTKKIDMAALAYSWRFTFIVIALLMLVNEFTTFKLSAEAVLGIIFFFMAASQIVLTWNFNRRGDV